MVGIKDMSLGKKLIGGFGLVVILLIIVSVLSVTKLSSLETGTKSLFDNEVILEKKAVDINVKLLEARREEKNFIMCSDLQCVDNVKSSVNGIKSDVADIQKLDVTQKTRDDANSILALVSGYEGTFLELVGLQQQIGLKQEDMKRTM